MLKTFKYRLYPNQEQQVLLAKHFGCTRYIYNYALENKIKLYKQEEKTISSFDLIKQLVQLKQEPDTCWLKEVNSQSLQQSILHLDKAFSSFFKKKTNFPRFKSRHKKQSFSCPQSVKVNFLDSTVKLPKIGRIKTIFSRQFNGQVKTCTISKTRTNKYFISILVETGEPLPTKPDINPTTTIGIDLGLKDFAITSDGKKIDNPRYLRSSEARLKILQRRASRKVKKSNNRKKGFLKVAGMHEKIHNQRDDFLHKVSTELISENQTICLENLAVKNMIKNNNLAKSISDVSWSRFVTFMKYKSEWYGVNLIQIGRFEPSSKMCSVCGVVNKDLKLEHRKWRCLSCEVLHDRDVNAAINIKRMGLKHTGSGRPGGLLEAPGCKLGL